jgi:hypothetical protein
VTVREHPFSTWYVVVVITLVLILELVDVWMGWPK